MPVLEGRHNWCRVCQIHQAYESDSYICPVCRDEQRQLNEKLYRELPS